MVTPDRGASIIGGRCRASYVSACLLRGGPGEAVSDALRASRLSGATLSRAVPPILAAVVT